MRDKRILDFGLLWIFIAWRTAGLRLGNATLDPVFLTKGNTHPRIGAIDMERTMAADGEYRRAWIVDTIFEGKLE